MNEKDEWTYIETTTPVPVYGRTYTIPSGYDSRRSIPTKNMCKFCKYFSQMESNTHFGICGDTTSVSPKSTFDETQIPVVHGEDSYSCWKGNWE